MFHLKLFLVVVVSSLVIWFAVQRMIVSTDHLPDSFTVENYSQSTKDRSESAEVVETDPRAVLPESTQDINQSDKNAQIIPEADLIELNAEEQMLAEALENLADEEASTEDPVTEDPVTEDPVTEDPVTEDPVTTDEAETDAMKNDDADNQSHANRQNKSSKAAPKERADSDADMIANNNSDNVGSSTNLARNTQGKALDLDKKLLEPIKPDSMIQDAAKPEAETIQALDLALAVPDNSNCADSGKDYPRVGIHYRPDSYAIKGQSLTSIDKLITLYRECGGKLLVLSNKVDVEESNQHLIQLRQDEVKYYLLQSRVPKADMMFPDY